MRVAILGASSQIIRDLLDGWFRESDQKIDFLLFGRQPLKILEWLTSKDLHDNVTVNVYGLDLFDNNLQHIDIVINAIGIGDPAKAAAMGKEILSITSKYDEICLDFLEQNPKSKYVFLSSGAVYGNVFSEPADQSTKAVVDINNISDSDFYSLAKLSAEIRHRAYSSLCIIDVRVFNIFSSTQSADSRFLITDALRSIRDNTVLYVDGNNNFRDYIHPSDFSSLMKLILNKAVHGMALDCYSLKPIDKFSLLSALSDRYGLRWAIKGETQIINATGLKNKYYSTNSRASQIGYMPRFTSLDGILHEMDKLLGGKI